MPGVRPISEAVPVSDGDERWFLRVRLREITGCGPGPGRSIVDAPAKMCLEACRRHRKGADRYMSSNDGNDARRKVRPLTVPGCLRCAVPFFAGRVGSRLLPPIAPPVSRSLRSVPPVHGVDGNSANPEWPKLAGQHAGYLVKQLQDYRSGARRNAQMSALVTTLNDADMADIAAYYAGQQLKTWTGFGRMGGIGRAPLPCR